MLDYKLKCVAGGRGEGAGSGGCSLQPAHRHININKLVAIQKIISRSLGCNNLYHTHTQRPPHTDTLTHSYPTIHTHTDTTITQYYALTLQRLSNNLLFSIKFHYKTTTGRQTCILQIQRYSHTQTHSHTVAACLLSIII